MSRTTKNNNNYPTRTTTTKTQQSEQKQQIKLKYSNNNNNKNYQQKLMQTIVLLPLHKHLQSKNILTQIDYSKDKAQRFTKNATQMNHSQNIQSIL